MKKHKDRITEKGHPGLLPIHFGESWRRPVALLLTVSLLLLMLGGCGSGTVKESSTQNNETVADSQTGLVEISEITKEQRYYYTSYMKEEKLLLFYSEGEGDAAVWGLLVYDMSQRKVLHECTIEHCESLKNYAQMQVLKDGHILIYNDMDNIGILYDFDLNTDGVLIDDLYERYSDQVTLYPSDDAAEESTGTEESPNQTAESTGTEKSSGNSLRGTYGWSENNGFWSYSSTVDYSAVCFDCTPDSVTFTDMTSVNQILCCADDCYLEYKDSLDTIEENEDWRIPHQFTLSVNLCDSPVRINEATTGDLSPQQFLNIGLCCLNDQYALVAVDGESAEYENAGEGNADEASYTTQTLYLWNYRLDEKNETQNQVQVFDESSLDQANEELISEIDREFDIRIISPYQKDDADYKELISTLQESNYKLDTNVGKIELYIMLKVLNETLAYYPEGMFTEIYDRYFDEYAIYLVNEIKQDDVGAFASNQWIETDREIENAKDPGYYGQVNIVLAAATFVQGHIPHEIMHTMEYNLKEKYTEQWGTLNPEAFSYELDLYHNYELAEKQDYDVNHYFMSTYATCTELEDRAVTFENMFMAGLSEEKPYWTEYKPLMKKVRLMKKAIRKSFSSVKNTEKTIWEHY